MTAISEAEMVGRRFGKLVVLSLVESTRERGQRYWICRCDCGYEKAIQGHSLRSGNTKSCGVSEQCVRTFKHGHSSTTLLSPTYHSWMGMKGRCRQGWREGAKNYIGRGITYDQRWEKFENFLADMGERPPECDSIDRRDNDKGYSKENCRWATWTEQARNRRNSKTFTYEGRTLPIAEWAEECGISYVAAYKRIIRHGSLELPR